MSIDPLVSLLVGALGAATLGLVGGAIGAWVQSRREHRRWLREQKMQAYTAVLDLVQRIYLDSSPVREGLDDELTDLYRATATVELLGPDTLADHTRMLRDAVACSSPPSGLMPFRRPTCFSRIPIPPVSLKRTPLIS